MVAGEPKPPTPVDLKVQQTEYLMDKGRPTRNGSKT